MNINSPTLATEIRAERMKAVGQIIWLIQTLQERPYMLDDPEYCRDKVYEYCNDMGEE